MQEKSKEKLFLKHYPKNINWFEQIPEKPITYIIQKASEKFPNHTAISFFGTQITYANLHNEILKVANSLKNLGVKKGTKVGLYLPNCPHYIISYYAVLYLGSVVVNFSPLYSEDELKNQIKDSDTEILITLNLKILFEKAKKTNTKLIVGSIADYLKFPQNILFKLLKHKHLSKIKDVTLFKNLLNNTPLKTFAEINPKEDLAVLQYTGGTTGVPKGAMLSHYNIFANAYQCRNWCYSAKEGGEVTMVILPLFHAFANIVAMHLSVMIGAKMILVPKFELENLIKTLAKNKVSLFPAVPTIYNAICKFKDIKKYNLKSIRLCVSGGDTLPLEVKKQFEEITSCTLIEGYGLTEASPVVCCNPVEGKNKEGTIGMPFIQTDVKIFSTDGLFTEAKENEKGELCVKGPQVMLGYYKRPDETAKVMQNGYLKTGDIGIIDEEGYIKIVDRLKQIIVAGGYKIYPRILEEAIYSHPKIQECAVISVTDEYRGQTAKAFLVIKQGEVLDVEDLKTFLQSKLSKYEMPTIFEITNSLPKTAIGKINKKELR